VALTEVRIRSAKPEAKPYKLTDGHGLFLLVGPSGLKSWRWKYRFNGKEGLKVLGRYPELGLREARAMRAELDFARRKGFNPSGKKAVDEVVTFQEVAMRWHKQRSKIWKPRHAKDVLRQIQADVFPALGAKSVKDITAKHVLALLRKVEERGAIDRAHRHKQRIEEIFALAISEELVAANPATALGKRALSPVIIRRHPAVTTLEDARALLLAVEDGPATVVVKLATRFMAVTALRSEAIRYAEWTEIEGDVWRIPAKHMKLKKAQQEDPSYEFLVPLPPQAKAILEAVKPFTGNQRLIFGGTRDPNKPMSDSTLSMAIRRLPGWGGRHVPHGWRSTFSTIMNEWASERGRPGDREVIDLMLAHLRGGVEGRYNRSEHLPRRRELAAIWAAMLLDGLPEPDTVSSPHAPSS